MCVFVSDELVCVCVTKDVKRRLAMGKRVVDVKRQEILDPPDEQNLCGIYILNKKNRMAPAVWLSFRF